MTATYIALATLTLTSTDSEIVFSSIPATYRDLVLVWQGSISTQADIMVRANGDTGSNYSRVVAEGTGSTTVSAAATLTAFYPKYTGTTQSNFILQIFDYAQTNKHKTALSRGNSTETFTVMTASRWANTNAINQLLVTPTAGTFQVGSTFSLYGIN